LSRARRFAAGLAAASLLAAAAPASSQAACTVRKNVEAIIDDSASMLGTDSNNLRSAGLKLIMNTPGNEGKTLGAIEFGDDADPIFSPGLIGTNRTPFSQALDQKVRGDNGSTNYNAAFDLARTHNPNADARLFLTDGAHNSGDYLNGHRGGPPTNTIGLGFIFGDDEARLKTIASETGGIYRKAQDDSDLQAAMNDVNARVNCLSTPKRVTDTFTKKGSKSHKLNVGTGIRSIQFALSWASPNDKFSIGRFRLKRGKRLVGVAKARKLKVRKRRGKTFVTLKLSGLKRGRLSYRVTANRVASGGFTGVKLITQASRSKRK
jgi:von Willebrand factor type A domain